VEKWLADLVGVRYVTGGKTPAEGFDCATLCTYIQRYRGLLEFPWNPFAWRRYCEWIPKGSILQKYDAILYTPSQGYGMSHVAIVIDEFDIIHANHYADSVVISRLRNSAYSKAARFSDKK